MITKNKQIDRFTNTHVSGWKLKINERFPADISGKLHDKYVLDNVRGPFEEIAASEFARTYKCSVGFAGRSETIYIKHYLNRSWKDIVKRLFRKGRAQRTFEASLMLQNNSFNATQIVALGKLGISPVTLKSVLITREVKDAKAIFELLDEFWDPSGNDLLQRHELIEALGTTIGKMHSKGISHGDLRMGNVLAKQTDSQWQFFFLDNERTVKYKTIPDRLIIKNLVQVNMFRRNIDDSDRERFIKAYFAEFQISEDKKRTLLAKVSSKTNKRLEGKLSKAI